MKFYSGLMMNDKALTASITNPKSFTADGGSAPLEPLQCGTNSLFMVLVHFFRWYRGLSWHAWCHPILTDKSTSLSSTLVSWAVIRRAGNTLLLHIDCSTAAAFGIDLHHLAESLAVSGALTTNT